MNNIICLLIQKPWIDYLCSTISFQQNEIHFLSLLLQMMLDWQVSYPNTLTKNPSHRVQELMILFFPCTHDTTRWIETNWWQHSDILTKGRVNIIFLARFWCIKDHEGLPYWYIREYDIIQVGARNMQNFEMLSSLICPSK